MLRVMGKGREELVSEPSPPQEQSSALPVQWHREGPKVEAGLRTALERSGGAGQRAEPRALGPRRPYFRARLPRAWWKRTSAGPPPGVQGRGRDPRVTSSKLCSSWSGELDPGISGVALSQPPVNQSPEQKGKPCISHRKQDQAAGAPAAAARAGPARGRPVVPGIWVTAWILGKNEKVRKGELSPP